ncbi:linker histone H1 and H5 family-domain-containing protein [Zychaea mexicana]|uniref:linker histone H1 and H5 family-domain-containing protein n=1 Tax=Zychaea mexicana TaxID=64656 RepID=UPI0022FDE88A|nr:linker histone H1 and H5 family-domain-containing protein [Zychaea mexicana]KAI9499259.1 linker histone H1 and H5 family-domain-containing protein [Zychaea mexicana]
MAGETTTSKTTKKSEHPPYEVMIKAAILALKERKGSSRPAIKKYILANYKVSAGPHFDNQISAAIKRGVTKGAFTLPKGESSLAFLCWPACACV